METTAPRPVERCVLRMSAEGLPDAEIGRRLRRGPDYVRQVRRLASVPRDPSPSANPTSPLRPVERRVLWWLDQGWDHDRVADLFGRTPFFVGLVERMAEYKIGRWEPGAQPA